jgi:hypothetical protein
MIASAWDALGRAALGVGPNISRHVRGSANPRSLGRSELGPETPKKGKPRAVVGHRGFLVQRQSRVWRIVITRNVSIAPIISATL